jgi:hypothetical protein
LIGYDPVRDLPPDHLARLVEQVVEETVRPPQRGAQRGQPPYDPRLCVKVLVYGYATGLRSSRQLSRQCRESLPYLFLTRGDAPSYRTLCTARTEEGAYLEAVWTGLFAIAAAVGLERLGKIVVDSTKMRAEASPEAVLTRNEFAPVRAELERILAEAAQVDAREAAAGDPGTTELGQTVPQEQMRDILRRVRKQMRAGRGTPVSPAGGGMAEGNGGAETERASGVPAALPLEDLPAPTAVPPPDPQAPEPMTPKMLQRIKAGLVAIQEAEADGRKHLCLTDPDARMMGEGREKKVRECHSWEVAVDQGLLVAAQSTQDNHDSDRLEPLLAAAREHEPGGITAVDADSGYYSGDVVGRLLAAGLDTCIPDPHTAADLHRGRPIGTTRDAARGTVPFTYEASTDVYRCPEGNILRLRQQRPHRGQEIKIYRAQDVCTGCPLVPDCLTHPQARRRTLNVGEHQGVLEAARQRFAEPEHQERYHHRGEAVETVFGFVRGTLGYVRWCLRGAAKVACEARLFKTAYQFRKVHRAWTSA